MPPKTPAKCRRTSKASLVASNTPFTTDEPPAHAMSETVMQFSTSYSQKHTWQLMSSARATSSPPASLTTPALLSKANLDHAMATVTPQSVQENLARSFRSPALSQISVASVSQASVLLTNRSQIQSAYINKKTQLTSCASLHPMHLEHILVHPDVNLHPDALGCMDAQDVN